MLLVMTVILRSKTSKFKSLLFYSERHLLEQCANAFTVVAPSNSFSGKVRNLKKGKKEKGSQRLLKCSYKN